jgi:hypothetical protein
VLALYLYTGPEFVPMNGICRSYPQSIMKLLEGGGTTGDNKLCTTLFCVSSALKKVAGGTELPSNGKVYRGMAAVPQQFVVPHGNPAWCGGVERAFMTTTFDKDVALDYVNGRCTVAEIGVGRIHIGADITFLSMVRVTYSFPRPSLSPPVKLHAHLHLHHTLSHPRLDSHMCTLGSFSPQLRRELVSHPECLRQLR